jgi:hypothetical protein
LHEYRQITVIAIVAVIIVLAGFYSYSQFALGTLNVELTDPPAGWANASQIYLSWRMIEVHRAKADDASGWSTVLSQGGTINLTRIIDVAETLGSQSLQPGTYNLVRFEITHAIVTITGENVTAHVPSGVIQIAITQGGIVINAGQTSTLLIELNITVHGTDQNPTIVPDIRATPV